MPLPSTMTPIATNTLVSGSSTVTFSNIPQNYTDLVLIVNSRNASNTSTLIRIGNTSIDSGSNYSHTLIEGNGSTARSARESNVTYGFLTGFYSFISSGNDLLTITNLQNYSNTSVFKTWITRGNVAAQWVDSGVGLWRNTAAITTIQVWNNTGANFNAGSTFTIYGIKAA